MKFLTVLAVLVLSHMTAFAQIQNSKLESRHQEILEMAIVEHCGIGRGFIVEQATQVELIKIDQGIMDKRFTSEFEVHQRVDQNIFDVYSVIVTSYYASTYDHESKDWGVYQVESISDCIAK